MKASLLLFLVIPLHSFAQYGGRSYTGPTMQQNQQSRQDFNRMTNQRTMDFQQRQLQRGMSGSSSSLQQARLQAQAKQQKAEQEATENLARLVQTQQRQRQEHPAPTPELAAAQQQADNKQLTLLTVKNYHDVFLTGQTTKVRDAQMLAPSAQQSLQNMLRNLLNDAWWSKQEGAPAAAKVQAYSDSLTTLTTVLLGFNLASPPAKPAPLSTSSFDEQLAKGTFDQSAATQLMQDAALTERLMFSDDLIKAVQEFATLAANSTLASDPKKMRKEVQKSMRTVGKEMFDYSIRIANSDKVFAAEKAVRKATATYIAKNSK